MSESSQGKSCIVMSMVSSQIAMLVHYKPSFGWYCMIYYCVIYLLLFMGGAKTADAFIYYMYIVNRFT